MILKKSDVEAGALENAVTISLPLLPYLLWSSMIVTGYDIKQSNFVFWGMWGTLSLPSLPGPLWSGVIAPDSVLSMGQIEPFDIKAEYLKTELCWIELLEIELFKNSNLCKSYA